MMAFSLALARAGRSMLARIAMMAITTNSSMRVKAATRERVSLGAVIWCLGVAYIGAALCQPRDAGDRRWAAKVRIVIRIAAGVERPTVRSLAQNVWPRAA